MTMRERLRFETTDESHRVTSLELFFDLVFVYALTQVTALMAADPTAAGVARGSVVLGMLWFAWCSYAWLGNQAKADEGVLRAGLVLAMMPMFVVALAIIEAFDDIAGGWYGPLVFAVALVMVRLVHLVVYVVAAGDDRGLLLQLGRTAVPVGIWATLLVIGAFLDPPAQLIVWFVALSADYIGIYLGGAEGWRLNAPAHFAERHGLIVIIALGESIVALGVGAADKPVSAPLITAVVLGLGVSVALWWAYFDVVAPVAERVLHQAQGAERARLGRDSYTYLHFPMVAGIGFLALGLKKVIEYVALYLLDHVAFRLCNVHLVNRQRVVAALVLLALLPLAWRLPALASLGLLAAVLVVLISFESVRYAEARHAVRHAPASHTGAG